MDRPTGLLAAHLPAALTPPLSLLSPPTSACRCLQTPNFSETANLSAGPFGSESKPVPNTRVCVSVARMLEPESKGLPPQGKESIKGVSISKTKIIDGNVYYVVDVQGSFNEWCVVKRYSQFEGQPPRDEPAPARARAGVAQRWPLRASAANCVALTAASLGYYYRGKQGISAGFQGPDPSGCHISAQKVQNIPVAHIARVHRRAQGAPGKLSQEAGS